MYSLRRRSAAIAAATVTAALACGTLLAPAVANAATPAPSTAPATPLSIFASIPAHASAPLVHGLGSDTVTFTVRNNTARAVAFSPLVLGDSHGVIPVDPSEVGLTVQAAHAPATRLVATGRDAEIADSLVPAGKPAGTAFSVPAKGSFTWKLSYGVRSAFPANDPDLNLDFRALGGPLNASLAGAGTYVDLGIAPGQSHPFAEFFTGGTSVAPGRPVYVDLNMSNYTGAAVHGTFGTQFSTAELLGGKRVPLALDVWENGRWTTLKNLSDADNWVLPAFTGSIAEGADHKVALRLRMLDRTGVSGTVELSAVTSLSQGKRGYLLSGYQFRPLADRTQ